MNKKSTMFVRIVAFVCAALILGSVVATAIFVR